MAVSPPEPGVSTVGSAFITVPVFEGGGGDGATADGTGATLATAGLATVCSTEAPGRCSLHRGTCSTCGPQQGMRTWCRMEEGKRGVPLTQHGEGVKRRQGHGLRSHSTTLHLAKGAGLDSTGRGAAGSASSRVSPIMQDLTAGTARSEQSRTIACPWEPGLTEQQSKHHPLGLPPTVQAGWVAQSQMQPPPPPLWQRLAAKWLLHRHWAGPIQHPLCRGGIS